MAPPRKHGTDAILDAARALVLTEGPRAASVAAIAQASGAPVGTLYHRFGSRDGVLVATWLRALDRFQERAMAAATGGDTAIDDAVALGVCTVAFARELPEDARLLLHLRPADLLDGQSDDEFQHTLAARNAPLVERLGQLADSIYGATDARAIDALTRAVVDLPYAVLRRHAAESPMPGWLEQDVAASVRALLEIPQRLAANSRSAST